MDEKKQKMILIIFAIISVCLLGYGIFYTIKHKDDGEILTEGKIKINYSANGALDVVTQPTPNENITLKTLPETTGNLTEINLNTLKKLFQTTKKSILTLEKNGCSYCTEFEPKFIEALEENNATAYKINISNLSNDELTKLRNYVDYTGTPTTYIIENGKVSHSFTGTTDKDTISSFIEYFYVRTN